MNLVDVRARPEADASRHLAVIPVVRAPSGVRSHRVMLSIVFGVLLAAFAIHLATFGAWIVDDAGISMAYARNLVHGHGLVAQVGQRPVEGFSNPAWVAVLAVLTRAGLLGRDSVLGAQGYVVAIKVLVVCLHGVVLLGLAVIVRRVLAVARRGPVPFRTFVACWAGAGLLLALNPSYVIWMGSGLENPLLAAAVVGLAAVATTAVPDPSRRAMIAIGLLAALAALTRPDGAVYAGVIVAVPLLVPRASVLARARVAMWGFAPFFGVYAAYLLFRRAYFGMWVPNTAVAKHQSLPTLAGLEALKNLPLEFGELAFAVVGLGVLAGIIAMRRERNTDALRVVTGGLVTMVLGVAAYVVLPTDWMVELRFLTAVWPLLSVTAVLAVAQLVALAATQRLRLTALAVLVFVLVVSVPTWIHRSEAFRASPTIPLCEVAAHYGAHLEYVSRTLRLDPHSVTAASPDIGGMLLVDGVRVVDLGGLTDRAIARLIWRHRVAGHVLANVRPTVILIHDSWVHSTGLNRDPRFRADYVDVFRGQEFIRRDALARVPDRDAAIARIATDAARARTGAPRDSCGELVAASSAHG